MQEVFSAIDGFMRSSPLGEFSARLDILKALYDTKKDTNTTRVRALMWRMRSYYSQFEPLVRATIQRLKVPLEKRLKDHARLSKWDERAGRFVTQNETLERSHRMLHRLVLEHRQTLESPVQTIIDSCTESAKPIASLMSSMRKTKGSWRVVVRSCIERVNKSMISLFQELNTSATTQHQQDIGRRLRRGATLLRKSVSMIKKGWFEESAMRTRGEQSESILNLCDSIVKRMQELQNSPDTLQATKQKAFVDLLRAVKRLGISSLSAKVPKELRNGLRNVFELPEDAVEATEDDANVLLWKSCELRFSACLARLQRLRVTAATEYSADMNPNHVKRMLNYSNHVMFMMLQQRRVLTLIAEDMKELRDVCTILRNGGLKPKTGPDLSRIRRVLHQTELLLSKRRGSSEEEHTLMTLCRDMRQQDELTEIHLDKIRDMTNFVNSIPKCILQTLLDEIEYFRVTNLREKVEKKEKIELNEKRVINLLDTVLETRMLASQTLGGGRLIVHEDENMFQHHQRIITAYKALRSGDTVATLKQVLKEIQISVSTGYVLSESVRYAVSIALDFADSLKSQMNMLSMDVCRFNAATAELSRVLICT